MKCFNFDKLSNSINIVFKLCFIFSFLKKYNKKRTVKKSCLKPYFGKLIFIVDLGKAFPFWNFYFYMFSFGFLYSCSRYLEYLKAKIENGSLRIKRKTVLGNNIKWAEDSHYRSLKMYTKSDFSNETWKYFFISISRPNLFSEVAVI